MARYTYSKTVYAPLERLHHEVIEILKECGCEVIYKQRDYIMAREVSGQVPYARLVTVEVLADHTAADNESAPLHFVIKNEEIPLSQDNHCHRRYQSLIQAIQEHQGLLDTVTNDVPTSVLQ